MDHYSILDHDSPASAGPAAESANGKTNPGGNGSRTPVSAQIAAANASIPNLEGETSCDPSAESKLRFPAEDGGRSLVTMAERDLDAALQLLADRAQYITGASGAAIALRRGATRDMICRASTGSNAPELGTLLSAEYGLSGESVRTRQALRCDDAERDPRVNRDGCRQLGIASVLIMPIVGDAEVIGVFELFSGKPNAFNERDISALDRLGRMVETAVRHAVAFETRLEIQEFLQADAPPTEPVKPKAMAAAAPKSAPAPAQAPASTPAQNKDAPSKKPLFWSAAMRAQNVSRPTGADTPRTVPPVLRQLQKCQACGFPVSTGRAFCVDCEDKQWRSGRPPQMAQTSVPEVKIAVSTAAASNPSPEIAAELIEAPIALVDPETDARELKASPSDLPAPSTKTVEDPNNPEPESADASSSDVSMAFLSSALEPSPSWFAANKYVLGAIVVVAIIIAAIALLR